MPREVLEVLPLPMLFHPPFLSKLVWPIILA
jgi:hypothetical protein